MNQVKYHSKKYDNASFDCKVKCEYVIAKINGFIRGTMSYTLYQKPDLFSTANAVNNFKKGTHFNLHNIQCVITEQ